MEYRVLSLSPGTRYETIEINVLKNIIKNLVNQKSVRMRSLGRGILQNVSLSTLDDGLYTKGGILFSGSHDLSCREAIMHYISTPKINDTDTVSLVSVLFTNNLSKEQKNSLVEITQEFLSVVRYYEPLGSLIICKGNHLVIPSLNNNYNNCFTAISALIGLFFGFPHLIKDHKFIGFDETFKVLRKSIMNKLSKEVIDENEDDYNEDEDDDYYDDDWEDNDNRHENSPWNDLNYLLWYALYFSDFNFRDAVMTTISNGINKNLDEFNIEFTVPKLNITFTGPHDIIDFISYDVLKSKIKYLGKKELRSILGIDDKVFMKFVSTSAKYKNTKVAKIMRGIKNGTI